jgi:hypothetical protein
MPAMLAGQGAVLDRVLERVTLANPETGYTIAQIAPERRWSARRGVAAAVLTK